MNFGFGAGLLSDKNRNETNISNQNYDPEHERTCEKCSKKLKTKDGILKSNNFNCSTCYQVIQAEDKKGTKVGGGITGTVLVLYVLIIVGGIGGTCSGNTKLRKKKKKFKGYSYEEDDDGDDD